MVSPFVPLRVRFHKATRLPENSTWVSGLADNRWASLDSASAWMALTDARANVGVLTTDHVAPESSDRNSPAPA